MAAEQSKAPGLLTLGVAYVVATVSMVWHHITKDGTLAAAGRQGIDEIGVALKAFPDAIQTQESGAIWNPTQGEIAASRADGLYGQGIRSPSEIAADRGNREPERDTGREVANDNERDLSL